MPVIRHLNFEGAFNARDLGGLPTADGKQTKWRALVRSAGLDEVTATGWAAIHDYGVRTIIDLRNPPEHKPPAHPRPSDIHTIHLPLDGEDREFWAKWGSGPQFGTPLYYKPHIERFPELSAAVISAIARAQPGGVIFHCAGGRDRTGMIAMMVLALTGIEAEVIAEDYWLSREGVARLHSHHKSKNDQPTIDAYLAEQKLTPVEMMKHTLSDFDLQGLLIRGGATPADIEGIRQRLLV